MMSAQRPGTMRSEPLSTVRSTFCDAQSYCYNSVTQKFRHVPTTESTHHLYVGALTTRRESILCVELATDRPGNTADDAQEHSAGYDYFARAFVELQYATIGVSCCDSSTSS